MLTKLTNLLKGKKTYLAAILMVVLAGLRATNYIDENTYQMLLALAGAFGLSALRAAVPGKKTK